MDAIATPVLPRRATPTLALRCLLYVGPVLLVTVTAAVLAAERAAAGTSLTLRVVYGVLVAILVAGLSMSFCSTILGAVVSRRALALGGPRLLPPSGQARTAVLLPIYEEDAARVFAAARAMADDLDVEAIGKADIFVLSDTRSAAAAAAEQRIAATVAQTAGPAIFYRRRADNIGRKAGNIADFCRRWGAAYDFMVVLDADSLMTGDAIARLVGAMEANPNAGLIQSMCYPVDRQSLFARLQQFSARLYGPLPQRGVAAWQGPLGNYWGHNAIVRTAAFASCCGLPVLPGPPPFGGEIMSHDTVEAALLLRRGYDVWLLPDGPDGRHDGSWEETPTNLLDHFERDRRWCRGNLQHALVLGASNLRLASYYHLLVGLLHYAEKPLIVVWLILYAAIDGRVAPLALPILIAALVVVPRLICVVAVLADSEQAKGFGGRGTLVAGAAINQLSSLVMYPLTLIMHLVFLLETLTGVASRWDMQRREDRDLRWGATSIRLAVPLAAAIVGLMAIAPFAPWPAALLAPGLLCAIPFAVLSSRRLRMPKLLRTPDDLQPHPLRMARDAVEVALRSAQGGCNEPLPPQLPPEAGLPMAPQRLRPRWFAA